MEISKMLTISTAHISKSTVSALRKEPDPLFSDLEVAVYPKGCYGFWVYCSPNMEIDHNNGEGIPHDLWECMKLAKTNGCEWLCLDSDGEIIEELPKYEW